MKTLLFLLLSASTAIAAPDLVVYVKSTGAIVSYDKDREIPAKDLTPDGLGFYGSFTGTNILGILSTTNAPAGLTNIVQLANKTILEPANVSNDPENNPKLELKRIVRALVKTINLRLPAGQKLTADELKAAIKAEM
jgi:hypothetical protein